MEYGELDDVNEADFLTPFVAFFIIGIVVAMIGGVIHVCIVRYLVKERLKHIPTIKKVRVKTNKNQKSARY